MDKRGLRDRLIVDIHPEKAESDERVRDAKLRRNDGELHPLHAYRRLLRQELNEAEKASDLPRISSLQREIGDPQLMQDEVSVWGRRMKIDQSPEEAARALQWMSYRKKVGTHEDSPFETAFGFFLSKVQGEKDLGNVREALKDAEAAILSRLSMPVVVKDAYGSKLDELAKAKAADWHCRYPWRPMNAALNAALNSANSKGPK